jgi:hypothetical protein
MSIRIRVWSELIANPAALLSPRRSAVAPYSGADPPPLLIPTRIRRRFMLPLATGGAA